MFNCPKSITHGFSPLAQAICSTPFFLCSLILAVFVSAFAHHAQADEHSPLAEVAHWLDRMDQALMQAHYEGELVFRANGQERRISVQEAWFDGQRYLRLRQQGDRATEIIRRGHEFVCLHPEFEADGMQQLPGPGGVHLGQLAKQLNGLARYYQFSILDAGPVAGRATVAIDMKAKDAYRFHHRLWLDEQTALVLKSAVSSDQQKILEQFEFLLFNPDVNLTRQDFEPPADIEKLFTTKTTKTPRIAPVQPQWRLGWVPPGFTVTQHRVRKLRGSMPALESIMYSDGIAAFTVFVELQALNASPVSQLTSPSDAPATLPNVRQGATLTHSRVFSQDKPKQHAVTTVVGDIPYQSAHKILMHFQSAVMP